MFPNTEPRITPKAMHENHPTPKADVKEIAFFICTVLNKIIDDNIPRFRERGDFLVSPGYGYDKFHLDSIWGSYDMSLYGLIHYIMYDEKIYELFLSPSQLQNLHNAVEHEPTTIYGPKEEEDNYEEIQYDYLDAIYEQAIDFVENKLTENGFDVRSAFSG